MRIRATGKVIPSLGTQTTELIERSNYRRLVADVAWFGLALAATSRFLSIYAIRLGASPAELSWLAALPGIALLISTGLSGWWRRRFPDSVRAIFWPSLGFRLVFLLPAFAPLFPADWQPLCLILAVTLPAIPQGVAGVIFIVLMREGVSDGLMTRLTSQRSLAVNITVAAGALGFGVLLSALPFPTNYQAMFVLAFAFSLMSQWNVIRIKIIFPQIDATAQDNESSGSIWYSRSFLVLAIVAMTTHLAFFSIITLTPLRLVEDLGADEQFMAIFGLIELLAGALAGRKAHRLIHIMGLRNYVGTAMLGTALAALIFAVGNRLEVTLIAAAISGASWTAATIGVFSLYIERVPANQSTGGAVAYQQVIAAGVFLGPMIGGILVSTGLSLADVIKAGMMLRIAAAVMTYYRVFDGVSPIPWRNRHARRI